ncbi:MAG: archaeosortase A [Methanomicrobiaceae archaeon]|nr:archaeosortase A [Methanomicrobiaceae archaeon]
MMDGSILVLISSIAFIGFLIVEMPWKKYCAMVGWVSIVAFLYTEIPYYISINNFLYPLIALLSVPFLAITIRLLVSENPVVYSLTRAAAVAFVIFAPFAYIEPLNRWIIGTVTSQIIFLLSGAGFPAMLEGWNTILRNGFRVEIILACTGIQSIAIMLGVAGAVPSTARQKLLAFLLVAPVIYVLNMARNLFVVVAYTEQWFPYLPEIASNGEFGYESFFWAHNVIAELGALIALIAIAYLLFVLIPDLGEFAEDLLGTYAGEVRRAAGKDTRYAELRRD